MTDQNNENTVTDVSSPAKRRRGKGFFITACVLFFVATLIFAYFLTAGIQIGVNRDSEGAAEVVGVVISVVLIFPLWIIYGGISGLVTAVFSALGIRFTKWSILFLVMALLYVAAPFVYLLILNVIS